METISYFESGSKVFLKFENPTPVQTPANIDATEIQQYEIQK